MFCCLTDARTIDDLPDEVASRTSGRRRGLLHGGKEMFCCLTDARTIDDLPDEVVARFMELLADAREDPTRGVFWCLPPRYLASFLRTDLGQLFAEHLARGA